MMKAIGNKRQFFWNDSLLDAQSTTARLQLSDRPVRREKILDFDQPWEIDSAGYFQILKDDGFYRMYYMSTVRKNDNSLDSHEWNYPDIRICYAESPDGLHWNKPALGLRSFQGSTENNILLDLTDATELDNFFVYKDENPLCKPGERYKAIGYTAEGEVTKRKNGFDSNRVLACWMSDDGIHFNRAQTLKIEGRFDTHNTLYWCAEDGMYHIYCRDLHAPTDPNAILPYVRDIRHVCSKDFENWSEPEQLRYQDGDYELHMYTNGVLPYYRGTHMWIGLPTRYLERAAWIPNYAHLPAVTQRKAMMEKTEPRSGLALTDCGFMCSENKVDWYRFREAFMTPGPENGNNWFYGDCYPAIGMTETETDLNEKELSLYMHSRRWKDTGFLKKSTHLYRYSMRVDGFACVHADANGAEVLTLPFTFEGNSLEMNFRTSAFGYVNVSLTAEDGTKLEGFSDSLLFGDALDRPVDFTGDLSSLNGKTVRLKLEMKDADVYSFIFL